MRRRDFIKVTVGSAAVWPLTARAQQPATPLIGFLSSRSPNESEALVAAFREGLGEIGYVEGQNANIAFRWAEGQYDRLPQLAAELLKTQVAVIASVGGSLSALAAKSATRTIPIVAVTGGDPVKVGLVASFNRPGGNITVVNPTSGLFIAKRLGLLRELVPTAALIGVLLNPKYPDSATQLDDIDEAARAVGQQIYVVNASTEQDIDAAFASLFQQGIGALISGVDPFFDTRRDKIIALAAHHAVPTIYGQRAYAVAGGLMSYAPSFTEAYRQAGTYVGRILKGEKPADLPVVQPTKYELVINLKTAKALGLKVPVSMQLLADEVIE
jgi:putative tryptophan/tyrosine transport system substrate-binding protein